MRCLVVLLSLASMTAFAGEDVVLASGARLHADRHETADGKVRLYSGEGFTELNASQVRAFEPDETRPVLATPPAVAAPAQAPRISAGELADAAADKYGLPRKLVRSLMSAESAGNPDAVSPKGAIGLMQLMPGTARDLGVDPHDPAQNVDAGVRYLRDLLEKYDHGLWHALAAYNAGEGAVQKYGGVPPYRETLQYIDRIAQKSGFDAKPLAKP